MSKDGLINRRKRARSLMRTHEAAESGTYRGGAGENAEMMDKGQAIKQLNAEANELQKSDPKEADRIRRYALKLARERRKRR